MNPDHSAAAEARTLLLITARNADPAMQVLTEISIEYAVDIFAKITPPLDPPISIGLIVVNSLNTAPQARSRKPGNILLNWRRLIDIVPDISLAGFGAATASVAQGWILALSGIYIWNKLIHGSEENFSNSEAISIIALWRHRDARDMISESDAFIRNNDLREFYGLPPVTVHAFAWTINRLAKLRCIELENGIISLREQISLKYS